MITAVSTRQMDADAKSKNSLATHAKHAQETNVELPHVLRTTSEVTVFVDTIYLESDSDFSAVKIWHVTRAPG